MTLRQKERKVNNTKVRERISRWKKNKIKRLNGVNATAAITKIDRMGLSTFHCTMNIYIYLLYMHTHARARVIQWSKSVSVLFARPIVIQYMNLRRLVTLSFSLKTIMLNWVRLWSVFFICIHIDTQSKKERKNCGIQFTCKMCRKVSSRLIWEKKTRI